MGRIVSPLASLWRLALWHASLRWQSSAAVVPAAGWSAVRRMLCPVEKQIIMDAEDTNTKIIDQLI